MKTLGLSSIFCLGLAIEAVYGKSIQIQLIKTKEVRAGCSFNLGSSSPTWPPHIFSADNELIQPVLEGGSRILTLQVGQQVTVTCEGDGNYLTTTGNQINPATCAAAGSVLEVDGQSLSYRSLGCQKQVKEVLKETGTCAHDGSGLLIEVGWQINPETFVKLYSVCHDPVGATNYYSVNTIIGKSVDATDSSNERPSFSQGGYFPGIEVNTAYTQVKQLETITEIVGSSSLANQYVQSSKNIFLSRGHLAPDGDFIDAASQDASYYFLNVLPQWQVFNGGNWLVVENDVRRIATSRDVDFVVYTGGFGVLTLADINGVQQPIYLAKDANNNGLIPVPKYYWKLVHDPATGTASAFVGINNPHLREVTPEDVICPDVCDQIPWDTWTNRFDITKGYMFCCTAASLRAAIPFVPDLGDLPLLV